MARQLRIDYAGAWHHVMNRGRRKESIFRNVEDYYDFLRLLSVAHQRYGIEINAYCLMGNHYHLLVRTPEGNLSLAMKHIDGVYAQGFNRRYEIDGPLFRGRFTSKLVDSDQYLGNVAHYIHRNPLDLLPAKRLEQYEWSSYRAFLSNSSAWPPFLYPNALTISGVRSPADLRTRTTGKAFEPFDPDSFPEVIGDPNFVNAALARAQVDSQTVSHLRKGVVRPKPDQIRLEVEKVFTSEHDIRLVELGLCQELGGLPLRALAEQFGYSTPQSAGSAAHRFRERLKTEEWGLLVERVRKGLEGSWVDERCR